VWLPIIPIAFRAITAFVAGNSLFINWQGAGGEVGDSITINFAPTPDAPVMSDAVFNAANKLTTLSGTAEANSSVSVLDGTNLIGTVAAASDGTWTLQANVKGNVVHSFTETSIDVAGTSVSSVGDTLYAHNASKPLTGGTGNDVLIGAPNDILTGGAGRDTFVFNPKFGKEVVTDFNVSQDILAFDHMLFANATAAQVLSQTHDSSKGAVIVVDAHETITLTGVSVAELQGHWSDFHFF
jgi:Ca2+-binding RTX toxin-like protein